MTPQEAVILTGKILARYPSSRVDEAVIAAWAEELLSRFERYDLGTMQETARAYCRANPRTFAPSIDELCSWMRSELDRDKHKALVEPRMPREEFRRRINELMAVVDRIGKRMP